MSPKITPPAGLGTAGRNLWVVINSQCAGDGMTLDARESRWLRDACFEADQAERIEKACRTAPLEVLGASGQPRPNGLLQEASRSRAAVGSLLARLNLTIPEPGRSGTGSRTTSTSARRAAMIQHYGDAGLGG